MRQRQRLPPYPATIETESNSISLHFSMVRLGDVVPNFTAKTQVGEIDFHEW